MELQGKKIDFPAKLELSFEPLLKMLESKMEEYGPEEGAYINGLIKRAEVLTNLKGGVSGPKFKKHSPLIHELMRLIFPTSLTDNEIKGVTEPWSFTPFYTSRRFNNIILKAGDNFRLDFEGISEDELYIAAGSYILGKHFGLPLKITRPFYFEIPDKGKGETHYYRLANNSDFLEIKPTDKAKKITQKDYQQLIDNFHDIALWKEKFPPESWIFSGFNIINMMDTTKDRILDNITSNLLNANPNGMVKLQNQISELLNIPCQISFVTLQGGTLVHGGKEKMMPLMLGNEEALQCDSLMCSWTKEELISEARSLAIPDVENYYERSGSKMAKNLYNSGMKSYFVTPVIYDGVKLGFLEIGSKVKGALNASTEHQLEQVLPILAVAGNRFYQEQENRIEAIIQAECTTIHPSVKWRFVEEAQEHIRALDRGEEHRFNNIVFKDVYPIFGQLDIRSSSVIRNEAIKNDLQTQLDGAKSILVLANKLHPMPLYDELIFEIEKHYNSLEEDMVSASEQDILYFLNKEIQPVLEHLSKRDKQLLKAFNNYEALLHPELHFVYQDRKSFDDSVNTLNKVLSAYIDKQQVKAQKMFPHHFERYSTDGLEFNMYVGESISPNQGFHDLVVKNLKLWQLMVMVELEREYDEVKKTLEKPLDVAALVLAYSNTLSIQYRMDEKNFDVEGAYNARYEIIKKRIDKAHIKGTDVRITEPGKLVVVYSREEDEREYLRYIEFLQHKGYVEDVQPEIVTLEDLQGVSGLKALRIGINYNSEDMMSDLDMDEIIAEIEGNGASEEELVKR